ncbi:Maf family protein, partial [Curtobacterium sp. CT11-45]|uniref:Maf family protein n=1 Tax=Curtobacterium sp. CT11-45 TaxID=3243037 RepID=UPI0039B03229
MRLYLASTSPARRALLAQTGIEPVLVAPGVDEDAGVGAGCILKKNQPPRRDGMWVGGGWGLKKNVGGG